MVDARSEYKKCIRNAKYKSDKMQTEKLEKARYNNAKEYWKLLKGITTSRKSKSLSAEMFANYFKAINDPNEVFFQPDEDVLLFNERYVNGKIQIMFD